MFSSLTSLQPRQLFTQILNFALVLSTAFMLWKGLSITTNSSSPIVVVLSGSMEPAFQRGDLLFLWNRGLDTKVGEIVVYNVKGKDIPIVHRVVRRFGGGSGYVFTSPSSFLMSFRFAFSSTSCGVFSSRNPKLIRTKQTQSTSPPTPHKRRQQRSRRHRTLRQRSRFLEPQGRCRG
jgi:hypothetical protein